MQDNNLNDRVDAIRLEEQWDDLLSSPLSEKLSFIDFDDGRLRVEAENPSWSQEASLKKESIKQTLNQKFDRDLVEEIQIKN